MSTLRYLLSALGWATIGGLTVLAAEFILAVRWAERTEAPLYAATPSFAKPSSVAKSIAVHLAPGFQDAAKTHRAEVVACGHGLIERAAIKGVYPVGVRMIPPATEIATDGLLTHFGSMHISDIAEALVSHAKDKGKDGGVHWSVWAAAERTRDIGSPPPH